MCVSDVGLTVALRPTIISVTNPRTGSTFNGCAYRAIPYLTQGRVIDVCVVIPLMGLRERPDAVIGVDA
jgi:hypothetical protein